MIELAPGLEVPEREIEMRASLAGGPGGQHVDKTASRVELVWDVAGSPSLDEARRTRILGALGSHLDGQGRLHVAASGSRSQSANRKEAQERMRSLVTGALKPRKRRRPTRPTRASQRRRLEQKKHRSAVKRDRRDPEA